MTESARCPFAYGSHRCEMSEGHTAPHTVVLRFDVARPVEEPTPRPRPMWARCGQCVHLSGTTCAAWLHMAVSADRDASDCATFARRSE